MNRKRFLSVFLSICLLFSLMSVTKSSATTNISAVSIAVTEPVHADTKYAFPTMKGTAVSKDAIAVSCEKDLLKMRDNLSGSYYLTKDITVSEGTQIFDDFSNGAAFTGTLDGKGHEIKGYKAEVTAKYPRVSLFGHTENATFKNLTLSDVDIKVKSDTGALVTALSSGTAKCTKVTVSGSILVSGREKEGTDGTDYEVFGICRQGTFKQCTNKVNITVDCDLEFGYATSVAGIADYGTFKNCKNTGKIVSKGNQPDTGGVIGASGIAVSGEFIGCENKGEIKAEGDAPYIYASGVTNTISTKIQKCSNAGKITAVNTTNKAKREAAAAGVAINAGSSISVAPNVKCFNTGAISIKQQRGTFQCGGVFAYSGYRVRECYNTGTVSVTAARELSKYSGVVGGVAGDVARVSECYNTGRVSSNVDCQIGGIAGLSNAPDKWTVIHCYNTGKVTGRKGCIWTGGLLGSYNNIKAYDYNKYYVYDNYSTRSPLYGASTISWAPYKARGKKVSSINTRNCPKLSSKYWTYSQKHKRLILKNVREK